ncbi:hypothetical protein BCR34DRAFT_31351 [Clohesyomyces aquaticus]|uniref:Metalloendopeptidase n=1 Tax=Clohesyomyces aquaticus TaxID=1231657 RepID=A0A1Y1Z998_9PLEO|nr:hypothetical protein BCR34DRAFT_31351 [Clohesyomyces aquaticus]
MCCHKPRTTGWNEKFPAEMLMIIQSDHLETYPGYRGDVSTPCRHFTCLSPGEDLVVADVAHEIGHATGMIHEHQRRELSPKHNLLRLNCTALIRYSEAVDQAKKDGKDEFTPWIAYAYARQIGFISSQFMKFPSNMQLNGGPPVGWHSLMMYGSDQSAKTKRCLEDKHPEFCPLARIVDEKGSLQWMSRNKKPIKEDVEWVGLGYPWKG